MIVAVQPLAGFDKVLHYQLPADLRERVRAGSLVRVPLLRRHVAGVVLAAPALPDCAPEKLKRVDGLWHAAPPLPPDFAADCDHAKTIFVQC